MSLELLPWNYNHLKTDLNSVHEFNQHMGINACLYHNMHKFENLVVVDLDEFIAPKQHMSLLTLIEVSAWTARVWVKW